jgi:hypothetical protein
MKRRRLLLSRLEVEQYLVELPPLPEERIGAALKYRLPALYPGSCESAHIDFVRNGVKGDRYVLFVVDEALLEAYRREAKGGELLSPTLIAKELSPRGPWTSVFWASAWASLDRFEDGALIASRRVRRSGGVAEDLSRLLPEGEREKCGKCASIFVSEEASGDMGALEGAGADLGIRECRILPLSRVLPDIRIPRALLFPLRPRVRKARYYALVALACLDLALACAFAYRSLRGLDAELSAVRDDYLRMQRRNGETLSLLDEIAANEGKYEKLLAAETPDMYEVVSSVAADTGSGCRILSLLVQEGEFSVEAEGPDALAALSKLELSGDFTSVKLHQSLPIAAGRERFTISGKLLLESPERALLGVSEGVRRGASESVRIEGRGSRR